MQRLIERESLQQSKLSNCLQARGNCPENKKMELGMPTPSLEVRAEPQHSHSDSVPGESLRNATVVVAADSNSTHVLNARNACPDSKVI